MCQPSGSAAPVEGEGDAAGVEGAVVEGVSAGVEGAAEVDASPERVGVAVVVVVPPIVCRHTYQPTRTTTSTPATASPMASPVRRRCAGPRASIIVVGPG